MSEERKTKTDAAAPASAALERIDRKDAFLQALHTFLTAHQGTEWAVAAVDIQHFKLYNELYGTEKGDVLLETMANCLLGYSKQTGYPVGYFGNDDFFLCLPDEKAEQTAVLATLQACMAAGRQDVTFFVVMGVCPVQANPGADAATLCNYAQIAGVTTDSGYLHRFEPTMLNELKEQQLLLGELERALDNHEFCFFLQPKCNSITRAIVGMEALVRWNHPVLGVVSPAVFIPVLESNGYITKLDQYIWGEVCKTIRVWIDEGVRPMPITVNVTKTDILAIDVAEFFSGMLKKYRIPPKYLDIDISRTAYLETHDVLSETVAQLQQMGFRVVLDGFDGNYMELSIQIKKYRTELHLSQEELAEKVYVTRQTISNWENEKSYPDIHSLLLLSSLFNVSLDQLIKGDIEKMKEIISEQEIKKFNYYGSIYTVHLAVLIISAVPLFMWLGRYAYIPFGILFIITMYWALKVEKLKKKNDIQTYKEIVAFTEGKKLDELHKAVEVGKRPYQNILKVIISAGVTAMICFLIGVLMHVFLN